MMEELYSKFIKDIGDLEKALVLMNEIDTLRRKYPVVDDIENAELQQLISSVSNAKFGIQFLIASTTLYLAGRFEYFVRSIIEELSIRISTAKGEFKDLPTNMRDSLIRLSSEVIMEPRRYGFAEGARNSFILNLANNLNQNLNSPINHQCLSITNKNMKDDVIEELFNRLGIKEIWKYFGEQLAIKLFFKTKDTCYATSNARKTLNSIMEKRNQIAHPSDSVGNWPSIDETLKDIDFLKRLALIIKDFSIAHSLTVQFEN